MPGLGQDQGGGGHYLRASSLPFQLIDGVLRTEREMLHAALLLSSSLWKIQIERVDLLCADVSDK